MFPLANPGTDWTLECGPHTGNEIAITAWNLPQTRPTQAQIDAVYAIFDAKPSPDAVLQADGTWVVPKPDRRAVILAALMEIDASTVRPMRAKLAGTGTSADDAKLVELENSARTLRTELAGLPA